MKSCSKSNIVDFDDVVSEIYENVPNEQVIENFETSNKTSLLGYYMDFLSCKRKLV